MAERWHPGITMHKLGFGGGFVGLLFAAGSVLIFLIGFPTLWYFVAGALALGIGIAALLHLRNNRGVEKNKPLSIVAPSNARAYDRKKPRILFRIYPRTASA